MSTYVGQLQNALGIFEGSLDYLTERKAELLTQLFRKWYTTLKPCNVLDVGCGVGLTDQYLTDSFSQVYGIDVDAGAVRTAQGNNPSVHYGCYEGTNLPYEDSQFQMAFAVNVIHHVPIERRSGWLAEVSRVVEPGGLVICMEHNPLNPLTQLIVARCECDKDASLIGRGNLKRLLNTADLTCLEAGYFLLAPFKLKPLQWTEGLLSKLPLGAQYFVVAQKRKDP